jgi:hypothetical protein
MNHSERDDTHLTQTLRALAEIEATIETPSRVEAAVMARWDAFHRSGAKADLSRRSSAKADRSRTSRFVRGAATAAGFTLVGALAWQRGAQEPAAVQTSSQPGVTNQDAAGGRYQTVAVVGEPVMSGEPVRVVRMRVARSVLSELGIPSSAQADTVDIDVLVGEDGVARGVRVPISEL